MNAYSSQNIDDCLHENGMSFFKPREVADALGACLTPEITIFLVRKGFPRLPAHLARSLPVFLENAIFKHLTMPPPEPPVIDDCVTVMKAAPKRSQPHHAQRPAA